MEQANRNEEQTFVPTLEDEFRKYHDRRTDILFLRRGQTTQSL